MTQKHTPTPWFRDIAHIGKNTFEGKLCEAVFVDEGETRTLVALVPDDRFLDKIVRACNSHAALVEALEGNLRALEGRIKHPYKTVKEWAESAIDSSDAKIKSEAKAVLQMIAALALAKGE